MKECIYYIKGYHNTKRNKGIGAEHIKLYLKKGTRGEITLDELLNIGDSIRKYLKIFKEPFVESNNAKIYEWQDENGVRFRSVTDKVKGEGHSNTPLSSFEEAIITFYSDRNFKQRMQFKNPKVEAYYKEDSKHNHIKE